MILSETEKEVVRTIYSRFRLGRKKYGQPFSYKNYKKAIRSLEEAIEEAVDLVQYLIAFKILLKKGLKK